jgi:hypothetical protein
MIYQGVGTQIIIHMEIIYLKNLLKKIDVGVVKCK